MLHKHTGPLCLENNICFARFAYLTNLYIYSSFVVKRLTAWYQDQRTHFLLPMATEHKLNCIMNNLNMPRCVREHGPCYSAVTPVSWRNPGVGLKLTDENSLISKYMSNNNTPETGSLIHLQECLCCFTGGGDEEPAADGATSLRVTSLFCVLFVLAFGLGSVWQLWRFCHVTNLSLHPGYNNVSHSWTRRNRNEIHNI